LVGPNGPGIHLLKTWSACCRCAPGDPDPREPLGTHEDWCCVCAAAGGGGLALSGYGGRRVMMGRFGRQRLAAAPGKHDRAVVQRSLEEMGIAGLADRPIGELSGGQQQRGVPGARPGAGSLISCSWMSRSPVWMSRRWRPLGPVEELRGRQVTGDRLDARPDPGSPTLRQP